ncbi:MAG: type II toxin-antitoxin system VapC family toxin [Candidatus Woesearchaeota archaeon]
MVKKVCLDTDVCIEIIKNSDQGKMILNKIYDHEVSISSITMFELLLRETNLSIIDKFFNRVEILEFNAPSSRIASQIFKNLKSSGKIIEIRDIFIASIAVSNNCELATLNKKHFDVISGLKVI